MCGVVFNRPEDTAEVEIVGESVATELEKPVEVKRDTENPFEVELESLADESLGQQQQQFPEDRFVNFMIGILIKMNGHSFFQ